MSRSLQSSVVRAEGVEPSGSSEAAMPSIGRSGLIDDRNSSVSSNGKRGYGPSLKPLVITARAAKAPNQASPSVAPAPYAAATR
jgi:hypothetical protein